MALFPVTSWIISNGHISATAHSIHLYSAHRAVIFAIAQLSCIHFLCSLRRYAKLVIVGLYSDSVGWFERGSETGA